MGIYEFIAAILASLAWPTVALVALVLLREPLRDLLRRLRSAQGPGFGIDFGRDLDSVETEARGLPGPPPTAIQVPPASRLDGLLTVASISPSAAILDAWREIEFSVEASIRSKPLSPRRSMVDMVALAVRELDAPPALRHILDELRRMRNAVAHRMDPPPSPADGERYVRAADKVIQAIDVLRQSEVKPQDA
jgi:hypothetical protein